MLAKNAIFKGRSNLTEISTVRSGYMEGISLIMAIQLDMTAFTRLQVLPVELLNNIWEIAERLMAEPVEMLTASSIRHLLSKFYSRDTQLTYYMVAAVYKSVCDIPFSDLQALLSEGFVIKKVNSDDVEYNSRLLTTSRNHFRNHGNAVTVNLVGGSDDHDDGGNGLARFISRRVAEHYSHQNYWCQYDGIGGLHIHCPHNKPFLAHEDVDRERQEYNIEAVSTVANNPDKLLQLSNLSTGQPASSFVLPSTNPSPSLSSSTRCAPVDSYCPGRGFSTGIKIQDPRDGDSYDLISYNLMSAYDRDYYLYLVHEFDPIAKVVYAFCF